jgi:nitrite reductase/ring-hydroxylating ferredoxin subunit
MQKSLSKKMKREDFFKKDEWTLVAQKDDLGAELGATKAVEAGMSPQGQNFIWTLVRGDDGDGEGSTVYATDGACRACSFPLYKGSAKKDGDRVMLECSNCGTTYDLENGDPVDWLPGDGPLRWAAAQLNKDKEPQKTNLLMTRVSRANRVYVRLPDGTLPIGWEAPAAAMKN